MRAAFVDLLVALYIDRKPHTRILVAERTRVWSRLNTQHYQVEARATTHLSSEDRAWFKRVSSFVLEYVATLVPLLEHPLPSCCTRRIA